MFKNIKSQISVLTYNVWMRPTFLFHNDQVNRAFELSDMIVKNQFDIIFLQECFDKKCIKIVVDKLKDIYPYMILPQNIGTIINSGLLVLSKYPLSNIDFQKFPKLVGADRLASKGFTKFDINIDSIIISAMLLHQQAGDTKKRSIIRKDNLSMIYSNKTDIIGGDFNTEGCECSDLECLFSEYHIKNSIPTWGNKTLDYIISKYKFISYSVLDNWKLSDHYPVSCVIEISQ